MRKAPWIAALLLATPFALSAVEAVAWNDDCGSGRDSSAYEPVALRINMSCQGALNDCRGDGSGYGAGGDAYTFAATADDWIMLTFNPPYESDPYVGSYVAADMSVSGPGYYASSLTSGVSFLAGGTGTYRVEIDYIPRGGFSPAGPSIARSGHCFDDVYSLYVVVLANDRPAVSAVSIPDFVAYGSPVTLTVRATDPDANGREFGIDTGSGIVWAPATSYGGTGTHTFTQTFSQQTVVAFASRDARGAVGLLTRTMTAVDDDCGLGRDVVDEPRVVPFACHGSLGATSWDDADNFTFHAAYGPPRLLARLAPAPGFATGAARLVLRNATGALAGESATGLLFGDLGTISQDFRLEVNRESGSGAYQLDARRIGAPAPPVLYTTLSSASPHQGDPVTLDLVATDPNGLGVRFEVDWGEGAVERFPAAGFAPPSTSFRAQHTYRNALAASPTLLVRAINEEALAAERATAMGVAWHADCAKAPGADHGGTRPAASPEPPATCLGELGYTLSNNAVDGVDVFRIETHELPRLSVVLATSGGLDARIHLDYWALDRIEARRWDSNGGNPERIDIPAAPEGAFYVFVERISGRGSYTLTTENVPTL